MGWIEAIIDAGAANRQAAAADDAANSQIQSQQDAMGLDLALYNRGRQDNLNALVTGNSAINQLARLYGLDMYTGQVDTSPLTMSGGQISTDRQSLGETIIDPGGFYYGQRSTRTPLSFSTGSNGSGGIQSGGSGGTAGAPGSGTPDYTSFWKSPEYQTAYKESMQAADRGAAARGGYNSGGHTADLMERASDLGNRYFGDYRNTLMGIAGFSPTASSQTGALGNSTASRVGQSLQNIGDARASGYINTANAYSNMANSWSGRFNDWMGQRQGYGGGGSNSSGYSGWGLTSNQANSGQGSMYNFGNNLDNFWGS